MSSESNCNGTVIIAKKQTNGKGRINRKWISPEGGIWLSIILQPKFNISMTTLFPLASAVALCYAIKKSFNVKWEEDKVLGVFTSGNPELIFNLLLLNCIIIYFLCCLYFI